MWCHCVASPPSKIRQEAQRDLAELWLGHKATPAWWGSALAGLPLPCADWPSLQLLPSLSPFTSNSLLSSTSHALPLTFPSASVLSSAFSFPSSRICFLLNESHSKHARNPTTHIYYWHPLGWALSRHACPSSQSAFWHHCLEKLGFILDKN